MEIKTRGIFCRKFSGPFYLSHTHITHFQQPLLLNQKPHAQEYKRQFCNCSSLL